MGQWDHLPLEIVKLIVDNLGYDPNKQNKWMFVNKAAFSLFQSTIYKNISVSLDASDKKLDAIIHSPFQPGNLVKSVHFNSISVPSNIYDLDPNLDPLHLLMARCSHVTKIELSSPDTGAREWAYFAIALMNICAWKLRSIISENGVLADPCAYFNCAYLMRESLTKLRLSQGMIGFSDYNRLHEFKNLTTLFVDKNVFKNMTYCDSILRHLPRLTDITINYFTTYNADVEANPTIRDDNSRRNYANIKRLHLLHFSPSRDEELLFIMKNFTALEELWIGQINTISWPPSTISLPLMESFFEFVQKISTCKIRIQGMTGENWLLDAIYASQSSEIEDDIHGSHHLLVDFLLPDYVFVLKGDFKICVDKENFGTHLLTLTYGMNNDLVARSSRVKSVLSNIQGNIQKATINFGEHRHQVGDCFDALLSKTHEKLLAFNVIKGLFHTYTTSDIPRMASYITDLEFNGIEIFADVLPLLSTDFPSLNRMVFTGCKFKRNENDSTNLINIRLVNTSINNLCLFGDMEGRNSDFDKTVGKILLLSVISEEQHISRYYISYGLDVSLDVMCGSKFDALKAALEPQNFPVISVQVKSIKKLSLSTYSENRHLFELSFT